MVSIFIASIIFKIHAIPGMIQWDKGQGFLFSLEGNIASPMIFQISDQIPSVLIWQNYLFLLCVMCNVIFDISSLFIV